MALSVPSIVSPLSRNLKMPISYRLQVKRMCSSLLSFKSCTTSHTTRRKFICAMDMTAGGSDGPNKLELEHLIDKAREVWESAPEPVKSFPWNKAFDNFIQLIIDIILTLAKYLYMPVFAVTSISEMSYCAHERKLYLILLPLLFGATVAGVLKEAALESSPSLKNAEVPWHLIAVAIFFTFVKLPGPYYPYWGRILIPHFANGVLLRTLWFAILWSRRPRKPSEAILDTAGIGSPEQDRP